MRSKHEKELNLRIHYLIILSFRIRKQKNGKKNYTKETILNNFPKLKDNIINDI